VARVTSGSPADRAGIRAGDVVRTLGSADVRCLAGLRAALRVHRPGDRVVLVVRRGEQTLRLNVELGARPASEP
jgi:S1-C subfamily serine protease